MVEIVIAGLHNAALVRAPSANRRHIACRYPPPSVYPVAVSEAAGGVTVARNLPRATTASIGVILRTANAIYALSW